MSVSVSDLLINLAFLITKPTGLMTYANQLIPHLASLEPTLLSVQPVCGFAHRPVPCDMTAEQGVKGHLRRLWWTQTALPQHYRHYRSKLLFTPIPEAPVYSECRYIATVHDVIPLRFPHRLSALGLYHRLYVPSVLRQAQHLICNSEATACDIVEFFGIAAQQITPIPLAYDQAHFRCLDLPMRPYFLYIGRSDPHKNLARLIAAFAQMTRRSSDRFELWLAGSTDGRYTPRLLAQASELGVGDRLKVLDYVPYADLPMLINQATAVVFPSLWEGFGLPVLEAMGCGTPVITSNCSSLPEVAGDAALLINPYSVGDIANAMYRVATDSQLRSHLKSAGLSRSQQFSWAKTGKATIEILRQYL